MDEELAKKLESLPEGGSFTHIEDDGDEVTYLKPKTPDPCLHHEWVDVGVNAQQCSKCGNGRTL